jgi:hypothetical protein
MAMDEVLERNVGILYKFVENSYIRWKGVAKDSRKSDFTIDKLFEQTRLQVRDNWDTWVDLLSPKGVLPTIEIFGKKNQLDVATGATIVRRRLTGLTADLFETTPLEIFGGTETIDNWGFDAIVGDFDGMLQVKIYQQAPKEGTYRGLIFCREAPTKELEALSWVVVHVT